MKRKMRSLMIGTVSLLFFLFLVVPLAIGQQQTQPQQQQTEQQRDQQRMEQQRDQQQTGQRADSDLIVGNHLRMGELIGMNVKDPVGEDLGSIEDVIVGQDGRVQHIIISHGGVLGIGGRNTPVPWEAAQLRVEADDEVMTNISKERLENAPSFTGDDYPNFADRQYDQQLRSYYGVEQQQQPQQQPQQPQPQQQPQQQQQPEQTPGQQQQTPGQQQQ
jgi:sporulation protein YlmC with PRC-barrel domain